MAEAASAGSGPWFDRVAFYLNGTTYWDGVPREVWDYTLGGYQVLKKWLSYREAPILGRALRPDEAQNFTEIARRIAALLLLQPELDANYEACRQSASAPMRER